MVCEFSGNTYFLQFFLRKLLAIASHSEDCYVVLKHSPYSVQKKMRPLRCESNAGAKTPSI